jgi:hypothetical protein
MEYLQLPYNLAVVQPSPLLFPADFNKEYLGCSGKFPLSCSVPDISEQRGFFITNFIFENLFTIEEQRPCARLFYGLCVVQVGTLIFLLVANLNLFSFSGSFLHPESSVSF